MGCHGHDERAGQYGGREAELGEPATQQLVQQKPTMEVEHGVQSLYKHQRKMKKWRTAEQEEAAGVDIYLMRGAKDLSGKDGDLVLMKYIEQYPPLISFVGMYSKMKCYKVDKIDFSQNCLSTFVDHNGEDRAVEDDKKDAPCPQVSVALCCHLGGGAGGESPHDTQKLLKLEKMRQKETEMKENTEKLQVLKRF
jgi:hypothetical protein